MRFVSLLTSMPMLLILAVPTQAQQSQEIPAYTTSPLRVFLDGDIGVRAELGFIPPSSDFGASFEYPRWRKVELQGDFSFSPDKKKITHDGYSIETSGTAILWPFARVGLSGEIDYGRLWTSQFNEHGTAPQIGVVIRTRYQYPGRLYVRYLFPTGCVWATPANPCTLQSKRLQGTTLRQEFQFGPYLRWGVEAGIYHFCAQSNENEPAIPRKCSWAGTDLVFLRFQLRGRGTGGAY